MQGIYEPANLSPAQLAEIEAQVGGYRTNEVCRMLGISYRQLDWWARNGLAVPSINQAQGSGSARRYSDEDLRELILVQGLYNMLATLKKMRQLGSTETLKRVKDKLEEMLE